MNLHKKFYYLLACVPLLYSMDLVARGGGERGGGERDFNRGNQEFHHEDFNRGNDEFHHEDLNRENDEFRRNDFNRYDQNRVQHPAEWNRALENEQLRNSELYNNEGTSPTVIYDDNQGDLDEDDSNSQNNGEDIFVD